ncbi:hypothetical protein C8R47DRAFT_1164011 [Mycena vitilis]|nr:hypothetical protein C8R47DRAFT_1164011 [Mycena vitilis]
MSPLAALAHHVAALSQVLVAAFAPPSTTRKHTDLTPGVFCQASSCSIDLFTHPPFSSGLKPHLHMQSAQALSSHLLFSVGHSALIVNVNAASRRRRRILPMHKSPAPARSTHAHHDVAPVPPASKVAIPLLTRNTQHRHAHSKAISKPCHSHRGRFQLPTSLAAQSIQRLSNAAKTLRQSPFPPPLLCRCRWLLRTSHLQTQPVRILCCRPGTTPSYTYNTPLSLAPQSRQDEHASPFMATLFITIFTFSASSLRLRSQPRRDSSRLATTLETS